MSQSNFETPLMGVIRELIPEISAGHHVAQKSHFLILHIFQLHDFQIFGIHLQGVP